MNSIASPGQKSYSQAAQPHKTDNVRDSGDSTKRKKEDFTLVSNAILHDPDLTKGAKLALIALLSYCWFNKNACFPGQDRLALDLNKSVRTVRRYLTELKEKKRIKVVRQGLGKTNLYTILLPSERTELTGQEQPKVSCPERSKVSAKTDEPKETELETDEALSNAQKGMAEVIPVCSHRAHVATGNQDAGDTHIELTKPADTRATPHPAGESVSNGEPQQVGERPRRRLLAAGMSKAAEIIGKIQTAPQPDRTKELPRLASPPLTQEDMNQRMREKRARERAASQNPLPGIISDADWQQLNKGHPTQQTLCQSK